MRLYILLAYDYPASPFNYYIYPTSPLYPRQLGWFISVYVVS